MPTLLNDFGRTGRDDGPSSSPTEIGPTPRRGVTDWGVPGSFDQEGLGRGMRYVELLTNLSELPVSAFSRVDLYRGLAPVAFGSGAIGGVLNLVTPEGLAFLEAARAQGLASEIVTTARSEKTRARVQQYQRYFADADRVLILLHNDPDPDALASGLALRNLLRRTKTTAIIGAMQGVTRPENLRMANMLDIQVEPITPASFQEFDRIATVDVQPHYFGGQLMRADLVIDPRQPTAAWAAPVRALLP